MNSGVPQGLILRCLTFCLDQAIIYLFIFKMTIIFYLPKLNYDAENTML